LFPAQHVAGGTVDRVQSDDILASQAGNGPVDDSLALRPLAQFARDIPGEALAGRVSHLLQGRTNLVIRDDIQKRGLTQIHGQGLLQCVVEHGIAGRIRKIRDNDRIFFR
jgi:hypothetical protein